MKRILLASLLLAICSVAAATDFSDTAPTGQTLYFSTTSATTVKVVSGSTKPSGRLTVPSSVQGYTVVEIAASAFSNCSALTSVSVPGSIATVGQRAFAGCSNLTSIFFAEGVRSIGLMAFSSCTALDTVEFPSTLTNISMGAFGNTAFINNPSHWENGLLLYAGHYLIEASNLLEGSLSVPDGTLGIANNAFNHSSLSQVILPVSIRFIGDQAFTDNYLLDTVRLLSPTPPTLGAEPFRNARESLLFVVPCNASSAYRAASGWNSLRIVEVCRLAIAPTTPLPPAISVVPGGIQVCSAGSCHVTVTDALGRTVASTTLHGSATLPLHTQGVYLVSIDGIAIKKICYFK